ncbi:MAG: acyl carrier protein [Halioglobus sp.]
MTSSIEEIKENVKTYILTEFLPGESPEALTDDTELVTHGVLDSLSTLQLVTYIEKEYSITVQAHEVSTDNINRLPDIANLVTSKL